MSNEPEGNLVGKVEGSAGYGCWAGNVTPLHGDVG